LALQYPLSFEMAYKRGLAPGFERSRISSDRGGLYPLQKISSSPALLPLSAKFQQKAAPLRV
jgi:hypothetical protein